MYIAFTRVRFHIVDMKPVIKTVMARIVDDHNFITDENQELPQVLMHFRYKYGNTSTSDVRFLNYGMKGSEALSYYDGVINDEFAANGNLKYHTLRVAVERFDTFINFPRKSVKAKKFISLLEDIVTAHCNGDCLISGTIPDNIFKPRSEG